MHVCVHICEHVHMCSVCCVYQRHQNTNLLEPQGIFQTADSDRQWIDALIVLHAIQMLAEAVETLPLVPVEEAKLMGAEQLGPEGVELS